MDFKDLLQNRIVLLDGAMGTMLAEYDLPRGILPSLANFTAPEVIVDIHRRYIEKGSDIICANTFGAGRKKVPSGYTTEQVVKQAVSLAKKAAAGTDVLVAQDVTSVGELLEPMGKCTYDEAYDIFTEQVLAGEEAGSDLYFLETMADLYEMKIAVLAIKEHSKKPILASMTFEKEGRSFAGVSAEAFAVTMEALGVDAVGLNCSLSPKDVYTTVERMSKCTSLPIIVKANAGLPTADGAYPDAREEFVRCYSDFLEMGVSLIGGCCGTDPDTIEAIAPLTKRKRVINSNTLSAVAGGTDLVVIDSVTPIGERLNPTGKKLLKQALADKNFDYIVNQAVSQINNGAKILDVNCGTNDVNEIEMLPLVIKAVQDVTPVPVQIDSSNPKAIEAALRICRGKPIVNSVNGDEKVLHSVLPLVKKYGAAVVGLTLDEKGIPKTTAERIAIAEKIIAAAASYGIRKKDIFIDPLTLTVSAEQPQAAHTLEAISILKHKIGVNTVLGVSNISFGLPKRNVFNAHFLTAAMHAGLTLPIINPSDESIREAILCYNVLSGKDEGCKEYVNACAGEAQTEKKETEITVRSAILNGQKSECAAAVKKLLIDRAPLDVVNNELIPTLDEVGRLYEEKKLFLPQLISCSEAAKAGFAVINETMKGTTEKKGVIILATVLGDVHDIGKNIVKCVLENYGFSVIDLGKNVSPDEIAAAAIRYNPLFVGLSALMTTTAENMEVTIRQLKQAGYTGKTVVGGAVITQAFADRIGADFYAKDATATAAIARSLV